MHFYDETSWMFMYMICNNLLLVEYKFDVILTVHRH